MTADKLVFAAYFESAEQLPNICRLAESIRTFGGKYGKSPIWAFGSPDIDTEDKKIFSRLESFDVEIRTSQAPAKAGWLFYAGKPYAAAEAETAVADASKLLIWMDEDTIVLAEPTAFDLEEDISLAYCPVMHNRSGSLYDKPPDAFWSRIYEKLEVADDALFPMVTPADKQKIRAYFHAGLLVVRPERKILRRWAKDFEILYSDTILADMCRADINKKIFLHQTALVGAVLNNLEKDEMKELTGRYNYPIFFEKKYDSEVTFDSIEDIITLRCVIPVKEINPEWYRKLAGPPDKIAWLKKHISG
jgi:hypothetical protein